MGAACVQGEVRNTGDSAERDSDPNTPQGWLDRESEGLMVPMKRVTTVEGRSPGSGCFTRSGRAGEPPVQVVMQGQISLDRPGLRMKYPEWQNRALGGTITTITEG